MGNEEAGRDDAARGKGERGMMGREREVYILHWDLRYERIEEEDRIGGRSE